MQWLDAPGFSRLSAPPPLPGGEVHLWLWDQEVTAGSAANQRLKRLLAAYLGCDPEDLPLQRSPHGKPFLEDAANLHFNLSHSGSCTAIAVSRDVLPGGDV